MIPHATFVRHGSHRPRPLALLIATLLAGAGPLAAPAHAQDAAAAPAAPSASSATSTGMASTPVAAAAASDGAVPAKDPQRVIVTGNPLGHDAGAAPVTSLQGDELQRRLAPTLGETLDGLPGVSSSWFGPNASRPIIRGLDGDRVRLLDNGGTSVDASNLSNDHAVAIDPLVIERVEVLRGPAALMYGGNATGGVVNTLDNRIPRNALSGIGGRVGLRLGGAADERAASAVLEGGQNETSGFNWHVDGYTRSTDIRTGARSVPPGPMPTVMWACPQIPGATATASLRSPTCTSP